MLSDVARAALVARRRGVRMSPESRKKIGETARRNREMRERRRGDVLKAGRLFGEAEEEEEIQEAEEAEEAEGIGEEKESGGDDTGGGGSGDGGVVEVLEGKEVVEAKGGTVGKRKGTRRGVSPAKRPEVGQKISAALKGRKMSESRKRKISASLKGRRLSAEHKRKLSARFGGASNPMYGRKLSKESRAKISESLTRRKKVDDGEEVKDRRRKVAIEEEKIMGSRFVRSLRGELLEEEEAGEEVVVDDILRRVKKGELPPVQVEKMRETVKKIREGREEVERRKQEDEIEAGIEAQAVFVSVEEAGEGIAGEVKGQSGGFKVEGRGAVLKGRGVGGARKGKQGRKPLVRLDAGLKIQSHECAMCQGSGNVECAHCVGQVGVASRRCTVCVGAGVMFCPTCLGAGRIMEA